MVLILQSEAAPAPLFFDMETFNLDDYIDEESREYIIKQSKLIARTTQMIKDFLQILDILDYGWA